MTFRFRTGHYVTTALVIAALIAYNLLFGTWRINGFPWAGRIYARNTNALSNLPLACTLPAAAPPVAVCYRVLQRVADSLSGRMSYYLVVIDGNGNTFNVFLPDSNLWLRVHVSETLLGFPQPDGRVRVTDAAQNGGEIADIDTSWRGRYNVNRLLLSVLVGGVMLFLVVVHAYRRRDRDYSLPQ